MKITLNLTTQGNGKSKEYWQNKCEYYVEQELWNDINIDSKSLKEFATAMIYSNNGLDLTDEWRERYTAISVDVDIRQIKKEILSSTFAALEADGDDEDENKKIKSKKLEQGMGM